MTARTLPPGLRLSRGAHEPPNGEFAACVMEAASWIAGEPWSDHPKCVCPVIGGFCREWNDSLDDEDRQVLLPFVTRIIGTNHGPEAAARRSWMAGDWLVRECAPAWLRAAGLDEHADAMERLPEIDSTQRALEAQPVIVAAEDAAWTAALTYAPDAVLTRATDAARAAAWCVAMAVWNAACAAPLANASGAACAATLTATSVPEERVASTVSALQRSALRLLERMIEEGRA